MITTLSNWIYKSWLDEQQCPHWVKEMILLSGTEIAKHLRQSQSENLWMEFYIREHSFSKFVKYLGCNFASRQIVFDFLVCAIMAIYYLPGNGLPLCRLSVYRLLRCWGLLSPEKIKAGISFSEHDFIEISKIVLSCFLKKRGVLELKNLRKISQLTIVDFPECAFNQMKVDARRFKEAKQKGDFGSLGI